MQDAIYALFPSGPNRGAPTYVAQDGFGYSFLSDIFMADFKDGSVSWQGFLRPYASVDEAKAIFEKYVAAAKQNGGNPEKLEAEGADQMFLSASTGLVDVVFRKGNVIGGANGAADVANLRGQRPREGRAIRSRIRQVAAQRPPQGRPGREETRERETGGRRARLRSILT